jgi:cytochrome c peroxidase
LFKNAFGDNVITSDKVALALSQFVRSIVSYQSKYDTGRAQIAPGVNPGITPFSNFTTAENRGKEIFFSPQAACASCHGTETFTAPRAENNGLESVIVDKGVGGITNNSADIGKFKVTTLRNVEFTAPYMHDGRFATLDEVIEHYSTGIMNNANLPPQLKVPVTNQPKQLNLTAQDKTALVAFLKTLTDRKVITDVRFSNPFK